MSVNGMNSVAGRRRIALAVVAVGVTLAAWGCNRSTDQEQAKQTGMPEYHVPSALNRQLNPVEIDSMQAMKAAYGVTRDEYWDGYGGVLANDAVEVWYPDGMVNVIQAAAMLKNAVLAQRKTREVFGHVPSDRVVIVCAANLERFRYATGHDWWQYSWIKGDTINIQAPVDLHARGILNVVGPREYFEWAIVKLSDGKAPRWVQEGLASFLSGEANILENQRQDFASLGPVPLKPDETEKALETESERRETRRASYNAYRMIEELVTGRGIAQVAAFVNAIPAAANLDEASRKAFGIGYDDLLTEACAWSKTEAATP